jgi:hypothetical protein
MELNVHIPENAFFTLYARGAVEEAVKVPGRGSFFTFEGVVILFYKYPRHRRAYIVKNALDTRFYRAVRLPYVKEPVGIILKAKGRRIDILRRAYFNLERINGPSVYGYDPRFWQRLSCLIDDYNGHHYGASKSSLMELSRRYKAGKGSKAS